MNKFLEIIYMNQIMDEDWEKCEETSQSLETG